VINALYTVLAFLVAIAVLIVVHEFGHYWVAKRLGVKVLRFSVGFGKPLWRKTFGRDQTEFVIAAFPIGGYVRMLDENEGEVPEADRDRAFNRQPVATRMAVVLAGPLFNLLFAVLAYWVVNMAGTPGIQPVVGKVTEPSVAYAAGFRKGDRLLRIDGQAVQTWGQYRTYLYKRALERGTVHFIVRTPAGSTAERTIDMSKVPVAQIDQSLISRGLGLYGYYPSIPPVLGKILEGPAKAAGLRSGDHVLSIDGQKVKDWNALAEQIHARPNRPVDLLISRNGHDLQVRVTPEAKKVNGKTVGLIGVGPKIPDIKLPDDLKATLRFSPLPALGSAVGQTWDMSALTLEMIYRMLRLQVSARNVGGPLMIAEYAGYSARIGWEGFALFLAFFSVSLGVLNLLPVPVLDGGHLLYNVIEVIRRKPLSERVQIWGQQIGIALLVALMVLAFYNDITRILK
jgi:regulator of sigma E protease